MGQRLADVYDETRVAAISAEIAAAIDAATFGSGQWVDVPAALSKAFPGSFGGLWNTNFAESSLNFFSTHNMDPDFAKSYVDHFAYINPWAGYWTSVKGGLVALSEDVFPARTFAGTEFYNDWLRPQKDVEAAAGMKLVGDRGEIIQFLAHFPLHLSESYSQAAIEVLNRVRGKLERSIDLARLMRTGAEGAVAEAALVERSRCAAFVVGRNRLVREANQMGVQVFSSREAVTIRNGRCFLADKDADARFGLALAELAQGLPSAATRITFRTASGPWQVTMAALPAIPPSRAGILSLLPPERMVRVLVADLRLEAQKAGDFSALSVGFSLTPAEILFCKRLFLGESIADAAGQLGITAETARTRLKAILQKTGTSRQGQLMLLLSNLTQLETRPREIHWA